MGPLSLRASCTHTRVRCTRFHLEAGWPAGRQLENRVASALQQYARRDPEARETLTASRLTQSPSVLDSSERLDTRSALESSQVLRNWYQPSSRPPRPPAPLFNLARRADV